MSGVFISYRGEDTRSYGALIYSELSRRFGPDQVFLDSESTPAGEDFAEVVLSRLRKCSVLLAVIGRYWLTATDSSGLRRIDSSKDWIRRELVEAFAHGLRVIPILTDGAEIPAETDLPADVAALSRCQYRRLHHRDTSHDLGRVVAELTGLHPELAEVARQRDRVPRQLPAAPRLFTGRARELTRLTDALHTGAGPGATVVISAIGGTGGIGKTALAVHWAHQNVERFPAGQLYVNLRGFDPSSTPMPPAVAVRGFLDTLGVEPGAIPADLDTQAALYRSLVAGTRMLIVLDNARDTAQVVPLLPGSATCTVLVTSRKHLGGLVTGHGAMPLDLDALDEAEARELLIRHVGHDRVAAESMAVAELLACCAGLPLALGIVAGRATAHPEFPLSVLADEIREVSERLDALNAGELSVDLRAAFSSSYQALDTEASEVFRLLGLVPGPDISLPAVASLAAQSVARIRALLRDLEAAYLVQQHVPGRYRMHDLIRLYAAERAQDDSPDRRNAALQRVVDFYLHTAYAGDRLLDLKRPAPIALGQPVAKCVPHALKDPAAALAWFDIEHPCLLATQKLAARQGWYASTWQLAWTLSSFQFRRGHLHDFVAVWRVGLAAVSRLDAPATRCLAHRLLGQACTFARLSAEAIDNLQQALTLAEQIGDACEQAHTHRALAWAWEQQGDDQQALIHASDALCLYEALDNAVWEARALKLVGWLYARLDRYQDARIYCENALALIRQHHHREGEADTLDSLGYIAHHTGEYADAIDYYHQALILFRDLGSTYDEANVLSRLGEVHIALGQHGEAYDVWQQARDLYQAQHRTADVEHIQQRIFTLDDR